MQKHPFRMAHGQQLDAIVSGIRWDLQRILEATTKFEEAIQHLKALTANEQNELSHHEKAIPSVENTV